MEENHLHSHVQLLHISEYSLSMCTDIKHAISHLHTHPEDLSPLYIVKQSSFQRAIQLLLYRQDCSRSYT